MNRDIRRAQERKERKAEKEKQKRREERRGRRRPNASKPNASKPESRTSGRPRRGRNPGRFSGVLAAATVFFIVMQALVPVQEPTPFNSVVAAGFYLLFGYFATLWLYRRGVARAPWTVLAVGVVLALGVEAGKLITQGGLADPLQLALIAPLLGLGIFLGRLVFVNAPG